MLTEYLPIGPKARTHAFVELLFLEQRAESKPKFLQDRACQFIRGHRGDPFILVVAYVEPHTPYNSPFNDEHSLDEIDLDPTAQTPPGADIPLRYRLIRERQHAHAIIDRKRLPDLYYVGITPEEYRRLKQRYFGLVTMLDRSIGAILACLDSAGLTDNTIIVHTSDHGEHGASREIVAVERVLPTPSCFGPLRRPILHSSRSKSHCLGTARSATTPTPPTRVSSTTT